MCKLCDELRLKRDQREALERRKQETRNAALFGSPLGPGPLLPPQQESAP